MDSSAHTIVGYLRSLVGHRGDAAGDDRELLRRFVERRDGDALAILMHRHGPMVLGLARRLSGDEHSAEDVFQATFLLLSQKARTSRRAESLACWLHGAACRFALQVQRARQRRRAREARARTPSPSTPLDELTAKEFLVVLDEELQKLPESQRAVLITCCLEGQAQEEAARRLGCSADAVRGRLERGRQRLRLRLEKRGLTLPAVLGGTLLVAGSTSPVSSALAQATLEAAINGSDLAPAAAALIAEGMRGMFFHKLKVIGVAVMLLALGGTGVGMMALHPQLPVGQAFQTDSQAGKPDLQPLPSARDDKPLSAKKPADIYGDALPEGAVMRLGTIRRRAVGMQLAVTADGKSIVGVDHHSLYLSIWDAATGGLRQQHDLPEPEGQFLLSPDGRWLAQAREEQPLAIWDLRTVEKSRILRTEGKRDYSATAFSRDGKRIAVIGSREDKKDRYDHLICVWNLADGKEIFRTELRNNRQGDRLAFSPDGNRLLAVFASESGESGLYCWDIAARRQAWRNEKVFLIASMVVTADGKVFTSPFGQTVDLTTGRTVELANPPPLKGIDSNLRLAMTPDGRTLLIPKPEGVLVWDMIRGKQLRTLESTGPEVVAVAMPDGKSIIVNDGSLQRWNLETGRPLWQDTFALGHIGKVNALAFSTDGKRLASFSTDGSMRLWDTATGQPLRVWRASRPQHSYVGNAEPLDITPDGRWILSAGFHQPLKLWDASSEKEVRSIALPAYERFRPRHISVFHLRIHADGSRAVGLFGATTYPPSRHKLATWDLKTGQKLTCHTFVPSEEQLSALSPDGCLLLRDGDLLDTASGRNLARLEGPPRSPCAFSRDGALVVGGSWLQPTNERTDDLRIWESITGKVIARLKSNGWPLELAFHPNNRLLAVSGNPRSDKDYGIQLYDAVTNKLLAIRRMPVKSAINHISLAFAPDGRRLATGMPDGTILIWDISLPPSKPQRLEAKEMEALWADLTDADAAKAWRAVWRLADAPQVALAFLRGRVKPYPIAAAVAMRKLLADLDSNSFEARESAVKRLKELGPQAEPALRTALQAKPSLEQRQRIEELLAAAPPPPTPEELRQLRALIVLERIGTPEARRLLEEAAKGPLSARLTRQARAALMCLSE